MTNESKKIEEHIEEHIEDAIGEMYEDQVPLKKIISTILINFKTKISKSKIYRVVKKRNLIWALLIEKYT